MKINLVVASGVHQGKAIPVPNNKLTIGRDPSCQLRPASPAVSKLHCTITVRDDKVFVADHGSTNGTFVNDAQITGEIEARLGDRVRVGPLDFTLEVVPGTKSDNTPLPDSLKAVPNAAGQKRAAAAGGPAPETARPGRTPAPMPKAEAPAKEPVKPAAKPKAPSNPDDPDDVAAMLLAEGDEDAPSVPDGSTVMELPAVNLDASGNPISPAAPAAAGKDKKKSSSAAETSAAANELLKKYMKRPSK